MANHELDLDSRASSTGAAGDASTSNSIQGKLGDPVDAAVAAGSEGSLFAHSRQTYEVCKRDVIEFTQYLAPHDPASNILDGDPTDDLLACDSATQAIAYMVLHEVDLDIPVGYSIINLVCDLKASYTNVDGGGGGNGDAAWYIVDTANKVGAGVAVSGDYEALSAAEATATGGPTALTSRSGAIRSATVTGPATIALAAKVDDALDTCTCTLYANQCTVRVTAKRV